jgi:hypothetical protein
MSPTKLASIREPKAPGPATSYRSLAKKVREIIEDAIAEREPGAKTIIDITSVRKRVHAVVVSEAFSHMGERDKQDLVWAALRGSLLPEELLNISAVITWGPNELR